MNKGTNRRMGGNAGKNQAKLPWLAMFISVAVGGAILQGAAQLLKFNGLQFTNHSLYYVFTGLIITGAVLAASNLIAKIPKTAYVRRMIYILTAVAVGSTWMTIFMWTPYLPYHYANCEHEGNKVAVMRYFSIDDEVTARLNEASFNFMVEAEKAAAEAQKNGETVEEVADTVTDMDLLYVYHAYPLKFGFLYDMNAKVEGAVYTLFGATSATIKVDWPEPNVAHLYVEGVEGEGESFTTID